MAKNTKFKPRQSGNPETRFKPGNPHRWQPGQSGNPSGRLQFDVAFYAALIEQGAPQTRESVCDSRPAGGRRGTSPATSARAVWRAGYATPARPPAWPETARAPGA